MSYHKIYSNIEKEMATHPLQYPCLENPMDRGAWWATVHGVPNSWTRLNDLSSAQHMLTPRPAI